MTGASGAVKAQTEAMARRMIVIELPLGRARVLAESARRAGLTLDAYIDWLLTIAAECELEYQHTSISRSQPSATARQVVSDILTGLPAREIHTQEGDATHSVEIDARRLDTESFRSGPNYSSLDWPGGTATDTQTPRAE